MDETRSKKRPLNRLFQVLYYLFLGALGIVSLFLILTLVPGLGGFKILVVRSGSMEPAIKTGSIIAIRAAAEYHINDVITFVNSAAIKDSSVTHRVIEIVAKEDGGIQYITKGDANEEADPEGIPKSNVWGKFILGIPYLGYGVEAARKPIGFLFIIIIPALVVIFDEMKNIWREIRKIRRKSTQSHDEITS